MCTLTWWREEEHRYALFFNRDELKTRLPAHPPAIREKDGTRFITPADGDHGGTWLLANEFGVSVALLNFYDANRSGLALPEKAVSRGELVLSLGTSPSPEAVAVALAETPLENYRPFHLFAIGLQAAPRLWTWGGPGTELRVDNRPEPPVTTSSFRTAEVCARRKARYREAIDHAGDGGDVPGRLERYHQGVDPEDGAFSVRMRRPDAQTVSYSRIEADADGIRFTYRPESLDSLEVNEATNVRLPLANA